MTTHISNPDLYVLLIFDELFLFVPQDEVESVEIISDVYITRTSIGAVGWFGHHGDKRETPVFCFTEELELLPDVPESREYFIVLKLVEGIDSAVGIVCDEVETVNMRREHLYLQNLPVVMKTVDSPLSQLLMYKSKIACVCSGMELTKYAFKQSKQFIKMFAEGKI